MEKCDKKVGIITEYCRSINYGGNLQAYALTKVVESLGYPCEQIQYVKKSCDAKTSAASVQSDPKTVRSLLRRGKTALHDFINQKIVHQRLQSQKNSLAAFNMRIPHSREVFDDNTIAACVNNYHTFITGSDQVWNTDYQKPAYFLEFVPDGCRKLSYAASLGTNHLSDAQLAYFKRCLSGFHGISVREEDAVSLLQPLSDAEVQWHLDPTLLLAQKEWDLVCDEILEQDKYIFCFFLGADRKLRVLAQRYARKHNLKIVTIPHVQGVFRKSDLFFGDVRRNDITPERFLSLIKHAECVFTDSFHASVFSIIYRKQFFVFHRQNRKMRASRVYNLLTLFDCLHRFCDTEEKRNLGYLDHAAPVSYDRTFEIYEEKKQESLVYLKKHLASEKE